MTKEKKISVACYCRVSTKSKEQASSFQNQQDYFDDYIKRNSDKYKKYDIYADEGISGTLLKRKEFDRMLIDAGLDIQKIEIAYDDTKSNEEPDKVTKVKYRAYIAVPSSRAPKFTEILVSNTSRFARNVRVADILYVLGLKGVHVRFLDINKSTKNPEDIGYIQFFQTIDESFSRDLSRKVRAGNKRSVANKTVRSHPKLYGYEYKKRKNLTENNKLVKKDVEFEVVQRIYRLYAGCLSIYDIEVPPCDFSCSTCTIKRGDGVGKRVISRVLSEQGIYTRAGKEFGTTTITNILHNEKYYGFINTGKYYTGELFDKKGYRGVNEGYLLEPDTVNIEPIISKELFDLCQENRQERYDYVKATGLPSTSSKYGGLLVCGTCGTKYMHNVDKGTGFYQCGLKKRKGLKACNSANVADSHLDAYIGILMDGGHGVELYQDRQDLLFDIYVAIYNKLSFIERNRKPEKVLQLRQEKEQIKIKLKKAYGILLLQEQEGNDSDTLKEMAAQLEGDLSEIEVQITKYTKKPVKFLEDCQILFEYAYKMLNEMDASLSTLTQACTSEHVLSVLESITVHGKTNPNGGVPAKPDLQPRLRVDTSIKAILNEYIIEESSIKADEIEPFKETVTLFSTSMLKVEFEQLVTRLEALKSLHF